MPRQLPSHLLNMVDVTSHVFFPVDHGPSFIILLHTFLSRATAGNFALQGEAFCPCLIHIHIHPDRQTDGWETSVVPPKCHSQRWAFGRTQTIFFNALSRLVIFFYVTRQKISRDNLDSWSSGFHNFITNQVLPILLEKALSACICIILRPATLITFRPGSALASQLQPEPVLRRRQF